MKIGDYVRTKDGRIGKIIDYHNDPTDYYFNCYETDLSMQLTEYDNIKSSPNIIDLIEVGDYVNGHRIIDIAKDQIRALYYEDINQKGALIPMINKDIKSIVTKEQFEAMQYKVGE